MKSGKWFGQMFFVFQFSGIRSPQGKCSPPPFQWLKNPGMGTFIRKFKFKELPRGAYPQWTSLKAKLIFGLIAAFESEVSRFCKYTTLLISLDLSVTLLLLKCHVHFYRRLQTLNRCAKMNLHIKVKKHSSLPLTPFFLLVCCCSKQHLRMLSTHDGNMKMVT